MLSVEALARLALSSPPIQNSARVRYKSKYCFCYHRACYAGRLVCGRDSHTYLCRGLRSSPVSLLPLPRARPSTWMIDLVDSQSLHRNTSQAIPPLIAQPRCRLPPFNFLDSIELQHYRPASYTSRVIYRLSLHTYMHLSQGQAWAPMRLFDVTCFMIRRLTSLFSTHLDLIVGQTFAPLSQRPRAGGMFVRSHCPSSV